MECPTPHRLPAGRFISSRVVVALKKEAKPAMSNDNWQDKLKSCFEDLAQVEKRQKETLENFSHFFEFVAEPAFESLSRELRSYKIKTKYGLAKGRAIHFLVSFPGSRIDNFHYDLILPKNSVELRLTLRLRGRRSTTSILEDTEEPFLERVAPPDVLKLDKETILLDIIERYLNFNREARTSPPASG
jgi:hypothetical protein